MYSQQVHVQPFRPLCLLSWALASLLLAPAFAAAQSSAHVLLVVNENSPESIQVGDYYAAKRSVAPDHVVRLKAPTTDTIDRTEYLKSIEEPIAAWMAGRKLQDQILYVVLTKGVPLRVAGTGDRNGMLSSVDSELTVLYRKLLGLDPPIAGKIDNPYFLGTRPLSDAGPFARGRFDIYLVTRLDGFTVDDVKRLIDRGVAPARTGTIVLDQKATLLDRGGDEWLAQAADRLIDARDVGVLLEETRTVATTPDPVLGYYSWGSNDPSNQLRRSGLRFVPGAIGGTYVSTDGRSFAEPPPEWRPSDPNGGGRLFAGSFQSLAGDLIRDGITGVAAHVSEPFLEATVRPQILFPAYLAGLNLAESFYLAMPFLSWRTVVIGDPLCTPFPRHAAAAAVDAPVELDPETELPRVFADRLLANADPSLNRAAVKLMMKIDARVAADPKVDAEPVLVEATRMEPRLTQAHLRLGSIYAERKDFARAIERYRAVVAAEPRNPVALNNLAYFLAENQNAAAEALPLAERAVRYSDNPLFADTLGWIHHLLGDDRAALPFLERAVAGAGSNPDVLVHAAIVRAAVGNTAQAAEALEAAMKLDPATAERADVKALQERLKSPPARGRSRPLGQN